MRVTHKTVATHATHTTMIDRGSKDCSYSDTALKLSSLYDLSSSSYMLTPTEQVLEAAKHTCTAYATVYSQYYYCFLL